MHALIDFGSTHSYVCIKHVFDKVTVVEQLSYDMHVTSPLGHSVNVNSVTPQKYPIIFIIILLYIPGINRTKLGFFREFVKCYMIV